jgi:hypothetical protein
MSAPALRLAPAAPAPWVVALVLGLLAGGVFVLQLPRFYSWGDFARGDPGSCLQADRLTAEGVRPVVDYPYPYGLLPLAVGRAWFGLLGRTPASYMAAMLVCIGLAVWGLTRVLIALRVGPVGLTMMAVTMPYVVMPSYPNLTHALEAVLICHALAEQAAGRRTRALALTTVCAFVKPSMAYVYGLVLLLWVGWDVVRGREPFRRAAWRVALATGGPALVIGGTLLTAFGWQPLLGTLFPLAAVKNYGALNYGFFGAGRNFWRPPEATWRYYVGTGAGLWLTASLVLLTAGVAAAWRQGRRARTTPPDRRDEIIVTAAVLHVAFVTLFFGHGWSWLFYSFLLFLGVALVIDRHSWAGLPRRLALALVLLAALLSHTSQARATVRDMRERSRDTSVAGLWVEQSERDELAAVFADVSGARAFYLSGHGCMDLLVPELKAPRYWMLVRGFESPYTLGEVRAGLAWAQVVVVPLGEKQHDLTTWPEFAEDLSRFQVSWEGRHYRVLRAYPPDRGA